MRELRTAGDRLLYRLLYALADRIVAIADGVIERRAHGRPTTRRQAVGDRLWIGLWWGIEQALLAVGPARQRPGRRR